MSQTSETKRNPYQPTTASSASDADIAPRLPEALADREIHFDGQADDEDLEELLSLTSTTGRNWLLLFPIIFGALILLMNASWPWVMCAVGLALFFLVLVSLLSRSYRRTNFLAFNPRWDQPVSGTIKLDGYETRRGDAHSQVRWDYHCNAHESESIVAFQSAAQSQLHFIIPRAAVSSEEQWELLRSIAAGMHCTEQQITSVARVNRIHSQMLDRDRGRLLSVPEESSSFAGPITQRDVPYVVTSPLQKRLAKRSYWYAGLATAGVSAVVAGLAGFVLRSAGHDVGPTPTYGVVMALIFLSGVIWLWLKRRGRVTSNQTYVELKGFVNQVGITFDYGFSARLMPWTELLIVHREDHLIALSDAQSDETIVLRRDMFPSTRDWQRCCDLANEHAMVRGVLIDE